MIDFIGDTLPIPMSNSLIVCATNPYISLLKRYYIHIVSIPTMRYMSYEMIGNIRIYNMTLPYKYMKLQERIFRELPPTIPNRNVICVYNGDVDAFICSLFKGTKEDIEDDNADFIVLNNSKTDTFRIDGVNILLINYNLTGQIEI